MKGDNYVATSGKAMRLICMYEDTDMEDIKNLQWENEDGKKIDESSSPKFVIKFFASLCQSFLVCSQSNFTNVELASKNVHLFLPKSIQEIPEPTLALLMSMAKFTEKVYISTLSVSFFKAIIVVKLETRTLQSVRLNFLIWV